MAWRVSSSATSSALDRNGDGALKYLAGPSYFFALLLVAVPLGDFLLNIWPLRWADEQWRYGSVGLFSGFLLTPLLAVLIAGAVSVFAGHRRAARMLGILNIIVAVLLVLTLAGFALDVLQIRRAVPDVKDAQWTFDVAAYKASAKYILTVIALAWLGRAELRAAKQMRLDREARRDDSAVPLVFGKQVGEAVPAADKPTT